MSRRFIATTAALALTAAPAFAHTHHAKVSGTPVQLDQAVPGAYEALYKSDPATEFFSSVTLIETADACGVISDPDAKNLLNKGATQFAVSNTDMNFYADFAEAIETGMATGATKGACNFFTLNPSITAGIQGEAAAAKTETFIP